MMWIFRTRSPFRHTAYAVWFFCAIFRVGGKMDNTFMKEKPVLPLLLSMALPMVISMLVNLSLIHI